jgi:hypothetical protein
MPSIVPRRAQHPLKSLAEQLRDGPLTSLILLERRAAEVAAQQPSGDDLIEALGSLVQLTQSGMVQFHECSAELQRLVDRLVCEHAESTDARAESRQRAN